MDPKSALGGPKPISRTGLTTIHCTLTDTMVRYNRHNRLDMHPPTLEEYTSAVLKNAETEIQEKIWQRWRENPPPLHRGDLELYERTAQTTTDFWFDEAEIFFNETVPQFSEQVKQGVEIIRQSNTTFHFILGRLLPVQMDTLIKFMRFLRCSWTDWKGPMGWTPRFTRTLDNLASEYNPESSTGLDGVSLGEDELTIVNNILDQVDTALVG